MERITRKDISKNEKQENLHRYISYNYYRNNSSCNNNYGKKDQFYSDLKKYAYEKGLVKPDTITLGQCHEDENTVVIEYFLEKDNKVEYRIMATINKQDNTYKFEYYM